MSQLTNVYCVTPRTIVRCRILVVLSQPIGQHSPVELIVVHSVFFGIIC